MCGSWLRGGCCIPAFCRKIACSAVQPLLTQRFRAGEKSNGEAAAGLTPSQLTRQTKTRQAFLVGLAGILSVNTIYALLLRSYVRLSAAKVVLVLYHHDESQFPGRPSVPGVVVFAGVTAVFMKRRMEVIRRPSKRQQQGANLEDVLAQMLRSGSICFQKRLNESGIPNRKSMYRAQMALPAQFIQEHGDKIQEWVILRTQTSWGTSSRPWVVRLSVYQKSSQSSRVQFAGGWRNFALGNRLKVGDSLIFLLKTGARSELEVHIFRGTGRSPYFPDLSDSFSSSAGSSEGSSDGSDDDDDDEENEGGSLSDSEEERSDVVPEEEERSVSESEKDTKPSFVPSDRVHGHRDAEHRKAFTGNGGSVRQGFAFQSAEEPPEHRVEFPGFRIRLTASNIPRSAGCHKFVAGQFEFPELFADTHGVHFQPGLKLQGVYDDSPIYVTPCCWFKLPDKSLRLCLDATEWSRFVADNGLQDGQDLQFALTADSYFVVRKVAAVEYIPTAPPSSRHCH